MINIVFCINDNWAKYCSVTIASILVNHKISTNEDKIHFFFLGNLSDNVKNKLLELKKLQGFEHTFIIIDNSEVLNLPLNEDRYTHEVYYRLLIPNTIPENVEKAIYLDADIVINTDIQKLWRINIGNYCVAAVQDTVLFHTRKHYFNSGVLVLNITALKAFDFYTKWKKYAKDNMHTIQGNDETILNDVLANNILFLPRQWNEIDGHRHEQAYILHFFGANKPWLPVCLFAMKNLWWCYAALSPFKNEFTEYSKCYKAKIFFKFLFDYWRTNRAFFLKPSFYKRQINRILTAKRAKNTKYKPREIE